MTTPDLDALTDAIIDNAQGPASAGNKTENASAHDPLMLFELKQKIKAEMAAEAAAEAGNPFGSIAFVQVQLPGACR